MGTSNVDQHTMTSTVVMLVLAMLRQLENISDDISQNNDINATRSGYLVLSARKLILGGSFMIFEIHAKESNKINDTCDLFKHQEKK